MKILHTPPSKSIIRGQLSTVSISPSPTLVSIARFRGGRKRAMTFQAQITAGAIDVRYLCVARGCSRPKGFYLVTHQEQSKLSYEYRDNLNCRGHE